jgi:hypothetical protein
MYHFRARVPREQDVYTVAMHLERGLTIDSGRREVSGFVKPEGVKELLSEIGSTVEVEDFSVVMSDDFFQYGL